MSADTWDELQRIFREAMELPASDREAFVKEACGDDADLLREVESLIEQSPASRGTPTTVRAPKPAAPGNKPDGTGAGLEPASARGPGWPRSLQPQVRST